jgi:hypothetical protein
MNVSSMRLVGRQTGIVDDGQMPWNPSGDSPVPAGQGRPSS